jgi:flagellum-specific peptidoglycan hydrolase FlgJ
MWVIAISIGAIMCLYAIAINEYYRHKYVTVESVVIELKDSISIQNLEDSVYQYILECNIAHPDVVLRQAKLESANFNSNLFKDTNNMFGMRRSYSRPNVAVGYNKDQYAIYDSWQESIIDYALYQVWVGKKLSKQDYINLISKIYAEDPNYKQKISN